MALISLFLTILQNRICDYLNSMGRILNSPYTEYDLTLVDATVLNWQ